MHWDEWATALERFWLDACHAGSRTLCLEAGLLPDVADRVNHHFASVEEAEVDFLKAVQDYQRNRVHPWHPEALSPRRPSRFLLLIAVQVYAVSNMAQDDAGEFTSKAYYARLAEAVSQPLETTGPKNFDGNDHQELWRVRLLEWMHQHGVHVGLPPDRSGAGRHVCLPKSQAALRLADLQKLPRFFSRCRYRPQKTPSITQLQADVSSLRWDPTLFTAWARRVFEDRDKFTTAIHQILRTYEQWDGQWLIEEAGRTTAAATQRPNWFLSILARQQHLVARIGTSWDDAAISKVEDLAGYINGKRLVALERQPPRIHAGVMAAVFDAGLHIFRQVQVFDPGDDGLIIGPSSRIVSLVRRAEHSCLLANKPTFYGAAEDSHYDARALTGIPDGCTLVRLCIRDPLPTADNVSEEWHHLLRTPQPKLIPLGGLRFDRKQVWIAGAGPCIRICGTRLPSAIRVNGCTYSVSGRIFRCDLLSRPGTHLVTSRVDDEELMLHVAVRVPSGREFQTEPESAWEIPSTDWPTWSQISKDMPWILGLRCGGIWNNWTDSRDVAESLDAHTPDEQLAAIRLLLDKKSRLRVSQGLTVKHPICKRLMRSAWCQQKALESP